MKPSTPIVEGLLLPVTVFAKDQPEYNQLPAFRDSAGVVLSRWHCSFRERLRILLTGDVYLWQATFGERLQPIRVEAETPTSEDFERTP